MYDTSFRGTARSFALSVMVTLIGFLLSTESAAAETWGHPGPYHGSVGAHVGSVYRDFSYPSSGFPRYYYPPVYGPKRQYYFYFPHSASYRPRVYRQYDGYGLYYYY